MPPSRSILALLLIVTLMVVTAADGAGASPAREENPLTPATKTAVVAEIDELLIARYIFLDVAETTRDYPESRLEEDTYDEFDDPNRILTGIGVATSMRRPDLSRSPI